MKPVIGITTFMETRPRAEYVAVSENYVYSVAAGGGLPLLIPAISDSSDYEAYLDSLDGILFTGGLDVSPLRYGQPISTKVTDVSSRRDEWEIGLFHAAYERRVPILGICRGHQLINIALGGDLIQDLPSELPGAIGHDSRMHPDELSHYVEIADPASRLHASLGRALGQTRILTNSFHHQAVKNLAPGLSATASSEDGVNEAYESKDEGRFLLGVQFHPEGLTRRYPAFISLFAAHAAAAAAFHNSWCN